MSIEINPKALKDCINSSGMTMSEVSTKMGRSTGFVSGVIAKGRVSETAYVNLCDALGVERGAFLTAPPPPTDVYRLNLVYSDSKVLVQLMCGDEVECGAWAIIKDEGRLGFIQAVSYATHMMYKFAQQNDLGNKESA